MEENMVAPPPSSKWEDLDAILLAEIFGRLDLKDRLLSIPFVCKPWKKASLLPRCWRILNFTKSYRELVRGVELTYHLHWCSFSGLLKLLLPRTQGSATHLFLPPGDFYDTPYSPDDLEVLSNECPKLKLIALRWIELEYYNQIRNLIGKWKDLECFSMQGNPNLVEELLREIGSHCASFKDLQLAGMRIDAEMTSALVMYTPDIEQLYLWDLRMDKKELLQILRGCKHLVWLSIKNCIGFNPDDEEILLYRNSIRYFTCENCKLYDEEEHYVSLGMRDVYDGNSDDGYEKLYDEEEHYESLGMRDVYDGNSDDGYEP